MSGVVIKREKWSRDPHGSDVVWAHCPGCDTRYQLDHVIQPDGTLSPSLECPTEGCGFHESGVKLEGWPERDLH